MSRGVGPGLDAAIALTQARKLAGQPIDMMGVGIGKDAADAAREAPLGAMTYRNCASLRRN